MRLPRDGHVHAIGGRPIHHGDGQKFERLEEADRQIRPPFAAHREFAGRLIHDVFIEIIEAVNRRFRRRIGLRELRVDVRGERVQQRQFDRQQAERQAKRMRRGVRRSLERIQQRLRQEQRADHPRRHQRHQAGQRRDEEQKAGINVEEKTVAERAAAALIIARRHVNIGEDAGGDGQQQENAALPDGHAERHIRGVPREFLRREPLGEIPQRGEHAGKIG